MGTVLWLLPDSSESFFRKTIRECAVAFNAPFFVPHVTLGRVPEDKTGSVSQLTLQVAKNSEEFLMKTQDLQCRDDPYQKLVTTLCSEKNYHSFCDVADQYFGAEFSKREDPHISLLYSHLSCDTIINKTEAIKSSIPQMVDITEIAVVELLGRPEEWKIVQRINFPVR